jgi:hypothetical protein
MKDKSSKKSPIYQPQSRAIQDFVKILLFARAGGRCEFDGCNKYLLEHHLTLTAGNYAQMAHIVAFSEDGPRGKKKRPSDINNVENVMLMCPDCHKLVDDEPDKFSRLALEGYKRRHEERILHVTSLGPDQKTSVLSVISRIGKQSSGVPYDQVLEAVSPRYPISRVGLPIDLTPLPTDSAGFLTAACDTIRALVENLLGPGGEAKRTNHVSLFALAPIPVLVYLGTVLSSKVPLDLYQRHRDTESWTWKESVPAAKYAFRQIRKRRGSAVALVLSLSGSINPSTLPRKITAGSNIYELTLASSPPNPTFLKTRQDLEEFRNSYHLAVATILRDHPKLREFDLFPAVPAPIAVLCGRELLPKVHPAINVYDNQKNQGGFIYQITINK